MEHKTLISLTFNKVDYAMTFGRQEYREGKQAVENKIKDILFSQLNNPNYSIDDCELLIVNGLQGIGNVSNQDAITASLIQRFDEYEEIETKLLN
jgi:O-acetylhomoserine/O-acetylserine sulfhydrylase-like pyridoxal-dependent enzyme